MAVKEFFQNAFKDMKESLKAQHEVDKAEFAAVKAESKAQWEEAKEKGNPEILKVKMQAERDKKTAAANDRLSKAQARVDAAKNNG